MYKAIFLSLALLASACFSFAATPVKSKKHRGTASTASSTSSKAKAPSNTAKTSARRKGKPARTARRSYQAAPTPERYKEIQQALVSKGYFKDEPNGEWGSSSVEALKHFQADQNLTADGKLNSLSLIALGLGPKHLTAKSDGTSAPQPAAPPVTPAPPQ